MKRFYPVPKNFNSYFDVDVPDYPKLVLQFNQNVDLYLNSTMLWAVAYSRLDKKLKIQILRQYYTEENIKTYISIAKQYILPEILTNI